MGRPDKLTPERKAKLLEDIAMGAYREPACRNAGIDVATFHNWMAKGRNGKAGSKYRDFFEAVQVAEATAERRAIVCWVKAMPESWQAAKDFLAARHPDRWSPRVQVTLSKEYENAADRLERAFRNEPEILERALSAIAGGRDAEAPGPDALPAGGADDPGGGQVVYAAPAKPEAAPLPQS